MRTPPTAHVPASQPPAATSGARGAYASRKRWWLPFVPRPALAQSGIALSFAFSSTRALAIRAAAYSVEYFG